MVKWTLSQPTEVIEGAKINGKYEDYSNLLKMKHECEGWVLDDDDDVILIDSFERAEHLKSKKKENQFEISVSSFLFTKCQKNFPRSFIFVKRGRENDHFCEMQE